jgi:hypothetical protein
LILIGVCLLALALPGVANAQALPSPQGQTVSGDQLVVGDNYTLKKGQTLNGNLVILGGNGIVESGAVINGDISLIGGNLDFAGQVNGSIAFIGGNVTLRSGSTVRGDINAMGGNLEGEQLATITGQVRRMTPRAMLFNLDQGAENIPRRGLLTSMGDLLGSFLSRMLQTLGMAVLALLLGLLIPKPLKRVSDSFTAQPWLSLGVGLLSLIILPFILVLLSITIILIPVTLLAFFVLAVAVVFGWLAVGYWVGERMAAMFKTDWAEAVSAGLGTLVLGIAAWLIGYVPCIGWLTVPLIASVGLGGVILSRFGMQTYTERYPAAHAPVTYPAPPIPPVPPSPPESPAEDQPAKPEEPSQ